MNIIFFGSPEFALPTLEKVSEQFCINLVVTQPDKPKGRGRKMNSTPVKKRALELGLKVISPKAIKTEKFENQLKELNPDYFVVVAYGRILPDNILAIPKYGSINIHPSVLPLYRGPAPVNWTLINGEKECGVTIMEITKEMDAGGIIKQKTYPVNPELSAGELLQDLSNQGASLICDAIQEEISTGKMLERIPQDHSKATYAPFLDSKTGNIDWNKNAHEIVSFINGLDPKPGAFSFYKGNRIKMFRPVVSTLKGQKPGEVLGYDTKGIIISCGDKSVSVCELQFPGKRRMGTKAVLAGTKIESGEMMVTL
jgi:methionyl-tRNA formyltransferase